MSQFDRVRADQRGAIARLNRRSLLRAAAVAGVVPATATLGGLTNVSAASPLRFAGRPGNADDRHERLPVRPRSAFRLRLPVGHAAARSLRGAYRARGQCDRQVRAGPRRVLGGERRQERLDLHHPFRRDLPRRHSRRCRGGPGVIRAIPDDGAGTGRRHAALYPGSGADHGARREHGGVRLRRAAAAPRSLPHQPVRAAHSQRSRGQAERGRWRPWARLGAAQ